MGYGMLSHFGISAQNSFGTATNSFDYMPIISESLTTNIEELIEEGMRARFDESPSHTGLLTVAGEIVFEPHPIMLGHFLRGVTGQASSTLTHSAYTWEFINKQSDFDSQHALPPFTIEMYRDVGSAYQLTDAIIPALTVEINGGTLVRATATVMAKVSSLTPNTTPSFEAGNPWKWDQVSYSIAGAANTSQEAVTISIDNQVEGVIVLNGTNRHGKYKRTSHPSYKISGTACFDDQTEYNQFRAQGEDSTNQRFIVTVTGDTTAQSYTNELVFDLPSVRYTSYPVNVPGPGRISVGWEGNCKYDTSSSYSIRTTMVNTRASY